MRSTGLNRQIAPRPREFKKSPGTSWIIETGQGWKLYVALVGFAVTLLCFMMAILSLGNEGRGVVWFTICGFLLGIATFAWLTAVLRCPHCLTRLVWTMVRSRPHSSWLIDLAGLESCPSCNQTFGHRRRPAS